MSLHAELHARAFFQQAGDMLVMNFREKCKFSETYRHPESCHLHAGKRPWHAVLHAATSMLHARFSF